MPAARTDRPDRSDRTDRPDRPDRTDRPDPPDRTDQRSGAQSVERALAVLRCFETAAGELGVTDIAALTGLSVSTAHRLVRALCGGGLLTQDARSERYQLGPALVVLGRRAEEHLGYARALPTLEALAEATGESVNLGIRSGSDVLVVLDVASPQPLRFAQALGSRVPLHVSAMGKCLLAFAPDPRRELEELPPLVRFTDRTLTDLAALAADLDRTRARGWALNDEERNLGVRAVAAPVFDGGRIGGGRGGSDATGRGRSGAGGRGRSGAVGGGEGGRKSGAVGRGEGGGGGSPGAAAAVGRTPLAAVAVQGPAIRLADDRLAGLGAQVAAATTAIAPLLATPS
ncbi:MAG TPA: IclR family transcriptional regulator [Acidimicrobiales bacterium]|nr:IclR family transcriptional regulator [Acidimicrobiales bacterium]